jgi:N-acetylmuramoyl-L-alanine amidase
MYVAILAFWCLTTLAADKPQAGAIIVVDPGHGGQSYSKSYTGGTRGLNSKMTESELNLKVALELAKILEEDGATVHLTRVADHRLSREGSSNRDELHARIDFFEHYGCHFFLSVHHNAGPAEATGHTAIYKHNAADDALYESLAREVNDSLAAAVPGPKRRLIKGSYHITRETSIPGTISEAGFLTNAAFDKLASEAGYAKKEAATIAAGASLYWRTHKEALVKLHDELAAERRDPKTFTATELNPAYQESMKALLAKVAPEGKYEAAKVAEYLEAFHKTLPPAAADFNLKAAYDGKRIQLSGKPAERKYHDQFIDVLVAMKLYAIVNEVVLPRKIVEKEP